MKAYDILKENKKRCPQCGSTDCKCKPSTCKCKPVEGWIPGKGFKKAVDEAANAAQQAAIAIAKKKKKDMSEMYGRRSNYYNPMDYERDEQRQMDYEKRAFKRAELQHELGHEDDPNFERNFRQQQIDRDRGPWYIKINGKLLRSKGEIKSFDWKRGANNYALAIQKNKPELQGKIFLTKRAEDDVTETATAGSTSAANVSVGAVYPNESPKMQKPTDNALDSDNLMTGGSIKR